jgi:hypothetical protein
MKDKRVLILTSLASDAKELTSIQQKLNTWMTTNLLVKYTVHTTNDHVIFNICLKKEEVQA